MSTSTPVTKPHDSTAAPAGGRWLYPLLLAMQTLGTAVLYWKGLPLYRQLVNDPTAYETLEKTAVWSIAGIALIQVGYWVCRLVRPALPRFTNILLGHLVLFWSRLSFLLATSVFSFVFITKKLESQITVSRYILTMVGLFSLFCYMLELQRLGDALKGEEK